MTIRFSDIESFIRTFGPALRLIFVAACIALVWGAVALVVKWLRR